MTLPADVRALPLRPCVGIMLLNRSGEVWIGRRRPRWLPPDAPPVWQMPQGGILPGERPYEAALRELQEETGVTSVELMAELQEWLTYELPPHLVGVALKGRYRGQRQRWFAMRFTGPDREISILPPGDGKAEFQSWRWASLDKVVKLALPFKRPVYETVAREFGHLAWATDRSR